MLHDIRFLDNCFSSWLGFLESIDDMTIIIYEKTQTTTQRTKERNIYLQLLHHEPKKKKKNGRSSAQLQLSSTKVDEKYC